MTVALPTIPTTDALQEQRIAQALDRLNRERTTEAWRAFKVEHGKRSARQVAKMEREQGLR